MLEKGGPIWTGGVKLTGARNEFVAFQVAVESETPVKNIAITVDNPLFSECKLPVVFQKIGAVQLYREWMVPDDKGTSVTVTAPRLVAAPVQTTALIQSRSVPEGRRSATVM